MPRPAVSVMMPCFNAAGSLAMAAASLHVQTLEDWECICIDDGSSDETWQILSAIRKRDSRFVLERFPENRGRGAARQRALELATGKYLAFLDSDDWMYPARLKREVSWLEVDPRIVAVCVCAAVTNGSEELIGVMRPRSSGPLPVVEAFVEPVPPPLLFPPSMIVTDLAQRTGFDPTFLRSQDSDFLIRALLGKHYALAPDVLYAYSQGTAASLSRTLEGYRFRMQAHVRHWRAHPRRVARTLAETGAKIAAYRLAGLIGADRKLIERRWGPASEDVRRGFDAAYAIVRAASAKVIA